MMVVRLSALRTGRLYDPGNIPGTHLCYRLSRPQGHNAAGRIILIKISNEIVWNRTRDLPACCAVPQPTASPPAPDYTATRRHNMEQESNVFTAFILEDRWFPERRAQNC